MASSTRRIVVDDSNPDIMFYGNWTVDSRGSLDGIGNSGPTFQHTLHTVQGDWGFTTFSFTGSSVDVVGRMAAGRNADGSEPTWGCMLDGQSTSSTTVERDQNNQVLCSYAGLQGNQYHYLTLQTNSDLCSLDYITYTPSSGNTWAPYRSPGTFVSIPSQDPTFSYDSSWVRPSDSGFATVSTVGATFNTTFLGRTLMWYGVIPDGTSGTAQGTYSIDGRPPVAFVVNRPTSRASGDLTNQVFFETPLLTYGAHTLSVTYTADGGLPLTLDRLVVRDQQDTGSMSGSGFVTATGWAGPSASASWSSEYYNGRRGSMSGGAIAGTVIGSVLGFALIVAALLFFWRRRRSLRAAAQAPAQGFVPHAGDEKAVSKADTSSIFSRIREKIHKEKEELEYAKPPVETEQLPAYKVRNSGIQEEVVDRV